MNRLISKKAGSLAEFEVSQTVLLKAFFLGILEFSIFFPIWSTIKVSRSADAQKFFKTENFSKAERFEAFRRQEIHLQKQSVEPKSAENFEELQSLKRIPNNLFEEIENENLKNQNW